MMDRTPRGSRVRYQVESPLSQLIPLLEESLDEKPDFERYGELVHLLLCRRQQLNQDEGVGIALREENSDRDSDLERVLGSDEDPDEYEAEGIDDQSVVATESSESETDLDSDDKVSVGEMEDLLGSRDKAGNEPAMDADYEPVSNENASSRLKGSWSSTVWWSHADHNHLILPSYLQTGSDPLLPLPSQPAARSLFWASFRDTRNRETFLAGPTKRTFVRQLLALQTFSTLAGIRYASDDDSIASFARLQLLTDQDLILFNPIYERHERCTFPRFEVWNGHDRHLATICTSVCLRLQCKLSVCGTRLTNASREIQRHELLPDDILQLSEDDMRNLVTSKASAWRRPELTMDFLLRFQGSHSSNTPFHAEIANNDKKLGSLSKVVLTYLPPWTLVDMETHLIWSCSLPREPGRPSSRLDTLPSQGKNTCAVDVCLVLGRLMRVGMNGCDQMPPAEERKLVGNEYLTFWMRATIARSWQDLTQDELNRTRDALVTLIRTRPQATRDERKNGFLPHDFILHLLFEGCRSVSWTQKGGYECLGCSNKTYDDDPAFRVQHTGFVTDDNKHRAEARAWKDWVNLPFKAKTPGDLGGLKLLDCEACGQRLAPLTFVLDRLPPFLVVSYGLEQISAQAEGEMLDDITLSASLPWYNPKRTNYRWIGLMLHINANHFVLHWRRNGDDVWSYDGRRGRMSVIPMARVRSQMQQTTVAAVIYRAYAPPADP
ncbi:MAG: hypothetical protein Q9218_003214 [Villophora microphyllina]